jgi:hypothetical protein
MPIYIRDSGSWKNVSGGGAAGDTFEVGTRILFIQANAPTGWVKESNVAYNNAALRIVTGSGGGVVDGSDFTAVFASRAVPLPYHNHSFSGTTGDDSPDHTHNYTGVEITQETSGGSSTRPRRDEAKTTTGASNRHQHGFSGSTKLDSDPPLDTQPLIPYNMGIISGILNEHCTRNCTGYCN